MALSSAFDESQVTNNYPNPLDEFVSYSYHFIMSVANTTTAFEAMVGVDGSTPYLASVLNAKHPGAEITLDNGEKAWVIIDTRRFSAYQITGLEMDHVYGTGEQDNPTTPVNAMNLSITDSTGMSFFNMLIDLFQNKIKSTRASSFFMLSIAFTGHTADGQTVQISNINIPLVMLSMEFEVDHKGSTYELVMMGTEAGVSRGQSLDLINSLGEVTSVTGPPTVGGLAYALERELNSKSVNFYRNYTNTAFANNQNKESIGKLVQYMITIPEEFKNFKCNSAVRNKHEEQIHLARTSGEGVTDEQKAASESQSKEDLAKVEIVEDNIDLSHINFSSTTTITEAITSILEASDDFLKLASEERRKAGTAIGVKTVVGITSDTSSYVVHVDVYPYAYPKLKVADVNSRTEDGSEEDEEGDESIEPETENAVGQKETVRNLMTFNYIFTGKNSSVLDLKIKYLPESAILLDSTVDIGQNRFASNARYGQSKQAQKDAAADGNKTDTSSFAPYLRSGDPVFVPPRSTIQTQNAVEQHNEAGSKEQAIESTRAAQEQMQTVAYMHFLSTLNLNMTIKGNPNILKKYADKNSNTGIQPHPQFVDDSVLESITSAAETSDSSIYDSLIRTKLTSAKEIYQQSYIRPKIDRVILSSAGGDSLLGGPDVLVEPVFCKINIFAPNIDYNTGETYAQESPEAPVPPLYTNDFFWQGPYLILFVHTSFSGGQFTHDLSLIPYDISGTGDILNTPVAPPSKTV